ncbi:hypothetical protein ACFLWF_01240 [Chloroflexota bacterium]
MKKTKLPWEKTDIPRPTKIKLQQCMIGTYSYVSWDGRIADEYDSKFSKDDHFVMHRSEYAYRELKRELNDVPPDYAIKYFPSDLLEWLAQKREDVRKEVNRARIEETSRRTRQTEEDVDRELQLQQLEHIGKVQSLAKSTIESYSTILHSPPNILLPGMTATVTIMGDQEFISINHTYDALLTTFNDLIGDALWPYLAAHLGDKAEKIEHFAKKFIRKSTLFTGEHSGFSIVELNLLTVEAQQLIDDGLAVLARTADVNEWEQYGLNPTCPYCPIIRKVSK